MTEQVIENNTNLDEILSVKQFCKRFNVSYATFYVWRKKGLVPKILKNGRRSYIRKEDLIEWEKSKAK